MGIPITSGAVEDPAAAYLEGLSPQQRRQTGQVFTPRHLVEFILGQAEYAPFRDRPSLLDPSCGAGAFLAAAAEVIAGRLVQSGLDVGSPSGRCRLLEIFEGSLFGVDIDADALKLARHGLIEVVKKWTKVSPPSAFLRHNLVTADFLVDPDVRDLPPVRQGGFDLIVGNPPYVSASRLPAEYKEQLRARFETAIGRIDLYTVFMEQAVSLLRPGGRFAFITPDKFLTSQTSVALRRLLRQTGAVRSIARFRSHKVFADAATVPCVTVFDRAAKPGSLAVLECDDRPNSSGQVRVIGSRRADAGALSDEGWQFDAPELRLVAAAIEGRHSTLGRFTARHSAGLATGRDALYVLAEGAAEVERELLRPIVRGRDLLPYQITEPRLSLLVPYTFDSSGQPALIDVKKYPKAIAYLRRHESVLRARHCVRVWQKAWFDLHDPVPTDIGRLPKILVPDVASHNRFAYDPGRYWPLHSAYYVVPRDIDPIYLTAVLNSTPIEFLIRLRAPVVKDGFSRYRKQFLEPLPVPQASLTERAEIVSAVTKGDFERADRLVMRLYRLRRSDLRQVRAFLVDAAGGRRQA